MQAQALRDDYETGNPAELDQIDFLEVLGALREEVVSMGSDVREVLRENESLKEEVSRLRQCRDPEPRQPNLRQIKEDCLDGLERLQELASSTRSRPRRRRRRDRSNPSNALMKKMMMFMMMAELV